ncbi:MAG: TonB-dependent receptor plug domain-containing protein [Prevotella sp.]|jgi:TonB-dependent SusC/RagA subfamily outer membrane receptor|nr:TonB-dependent receptor plug domain-containing protein [Prevotella sp.]
MKTLLFAVFVGLFPVCCVSAQEQSVPPDTLVGLVVNLKGKAMKNVKIVGKTVDVVSTDKKGIFVITGQALPDTLTLLLSAKDMVSVPVAGMNFLKIMINDKKLHYVNQAKDEIIDVGYGSVKKSRQSSSSSSITGEELLKTGESDLIRALAGKISGVRIAYLSDGTPTLRIRGATSIKEENNSPIFVVDGNISDNPGLINISDIERVDILKDGSIYGAKGANGAVIVTLKK